MFLAIKVSIMTGLFLINFVISDIYKNNWIVDYLL